METSTSETDFAQDIVCTATTTENFQIYRSFLEYFAENVDPTDQLPVRVPNYTLDENEISGAVIDWMIQYLTDKNCPQTLVAPIIKLALDQTHQTLRKSPEQFGYLASTNEYQTLKLMQLSISKINDVCQSLLDNLQLDKLIPSPPTKRPPLYTAKGVKNTRRHMEDRHIIIDDFNSVFGVKDGDSTSYYAIFDGHGGTDAAAYSVSHLHCEIVASKYYPSQPHEALREAFLHTDDKFIEKSKKQKLIAGTTALCVLYRPTELVVGWVGDSKALLVSQNRVLQLVVPHKPDSDTERKRIEDSGGCVLEFPAGCFRVNGRLAVSRAIGDYGLKDVVISEPDIKCVPLNGKEDFLILACDGLWDYVSEDEVATHVYISLEKNNGDVQPIAGQLIELSKKHSSSDNISVIVVFLKDPHQIIAEYKLADKTQVARMDFESTNGCHHLDDGMLPSDPSAVVVLDDTPSPDKMHVDFKPSEAQPIDDFYFGKNGEAEYHSPINTLPSSITSNGDAEKLHVARSIDDDHDDFGPETDVDATDDNAISPLSPSGYDFIERVGDDVVTTEQHPEDVSEVLVKKSDNNDDIQHPFEDNRFMDHEHFTAAANHFEQQNEHYEDDEPELPNKIDFAEKKDYDCAEFDEDDDDDDDVHDLNADMPENIHLMGDVITSECEQHVLPTNSSVPIENVVVAESGDDSDDEWNYIKVDKEKPDQELDTPIELDSDKEVKPAADEDITSPTPPTTSLGEIDFINQESHAIAQAFVEPEEVCSELSEDKQDTEQPELFDLDRVERSPSVATEHDSELGKDKDLDEDMENSLLNPDAKEFVPVSPQRTSVTSPFGNGLHPRAMDLMDDDVVSQSPRKGSAVAMEDNDIELPAENDFTEISQRPSELEANSQENGDDAVKDAQRPESSSSQCSYQEMNLKEAMHGDEKQELAAEVHESDNMFAGGDGDVPVPTINGDQLYTEQNPMNMSFYNEENNPFTTQEVDMNAVQMLPDCDDELIPDNEIVQYVNEPVELANQNYGEMDELMKEFSSEGEKITQHQELLQQDEESTPITNFVNELASEVRSILNEVEQSNAELGVTPNLMDTETSANAVEVASPEILDNTGLSADANEFVPTPDLVPDVFDVQPTIPIVSNVPQGMEQSEDSSSDESCACEGGFVGETDLLSKFLREDLAAGKCTQEEYDGMMNQIIASEKAAEALNQEPVVESSASNEVAAVAAVVATTAVAAAAVGVEKAAPKPKAAEAKKPEVKSRVAPIKKATTTTATKVAAKPSTTAPKAAAPRLATRTVPPKVSSVTEKKPATSTVTRKPLSNGTGVTSTVTKKTTVTSSTVTKSSVGTTRTSGTAPKPATARPASATTTATRTSAPKPATSTTAPRTTVPRVPLSARTVTKAAPSTTAAPKVGATRTVTSTVSSTASRVKSAPVSSTVRSTTLTKPKTTTVSDKLSVPRSTISKTSPTKPASTVAAKSPAARLSANPPSTATRLTPTRKPLSTVSKTTPSKSPKVPTTNGVASKAKVPSKAGAGAADKAKVTTNGTAKTNGHIEENGTGAEKIIDVSAD